ncbi:MAG: LamG domain-containing protein [Candidatus Brocadia sinica]|nr:LamG domain-containing protein [Candidatus Brocadia sinica]
MKLRGSLSGFIILFFVVFLLIATRLISTVLADNSWKNWYSIVCRGTPEENARYAKQMGYDYIAIHWRGEVYPSTYKGKQEYANLKFYILEPERRIGPTFGIKMDIDTKNSYTQAQIDFYNKHMAWKSNDPFPNNLATGWFQGTSTQFCAMWDFQQQAVIDMVVEECINLFHSYEDTNLPFTFAGYMIDVPALAGAFWRWENNKNVFTRLSYWTGTESGLVHGAITHEYATYEDGKAAFFKQLNNRMRQEFPDAKWIVEPYYLYKTNAQDEWIYQIKDRYDKEGLTPDMLSQESSGADFVDNTNIFNSGVTVTKDMVGISQPNSVDEYENRLYAAKAGINGAWYNWFLRFGGTGDMPNFQSITEVYPRLKLIRCLPNWDNLNTVPLVDRSWDGSVYRSTKSYASSDVMYSRQPKTGKLFVVFVTKNGVVKLNAGETVTGVQRADGYFIESGDGSADVAIVGDEIRLKSGVSIDVDATNGQVKGRGYIFTVSTSTGIPPKVVTGSATDVTSNSATLGGTVNANGLSTTAWFEYGTISGTYGSKSSAQGVSSSGDTAISIGINGLSAAKTYYYRLVAQNSAGTAYGSEMSLITPDTLAPNCSVNINNGDFYTTSTAVTLDLSATDDVGVTGYYLSMDSTVPLASAAEWTMVSSTTAFHASVSYNLSAGDGGKTVYAWYKDAAGNVSNTTSDSITLDTTIPLITITSPTSNTTHTTTSGTITLGGSASDSASGVSKVAWSSDKGGSGTASGTTGWSISGISLSTGDNVITVTVTDGANNTGTDTITVEKLETNTGTGLQACYPFNEGTGTIATDKSGNGNDGAINGATWAAGKRGKGLSFNGASNSVSIPLLNHDEISIAAWFYKNANDTTDADAILGAWKWNSDIQLREGFDVRFYNTTPDRLEFILVTQDGNGKKTQRTAVKDLSNSVGKWYHVAGTYNKTTGEQRLYVGGLLVDTKFHPAGNTIVPSTSYADVRIGYSMVNNGYFNGKIDEVYFYNKPLSDQEVQDLYNAVSDGMQSRYTFDEGSGLVATDSSGNGNDGAIVGATWTTGKNGKALNFDGINDFVSVPRTNQDEISIAAWFYKTVNDKKAVDAILGAWKWNSDIQLREGFDVRFYNTTPDRLEFILVTQDGNGKKTQRTAVKDLSNSVGKWYHVAGTYNKTTGEQRLYVGGLLVDTKFHPAGNTIVPSTSYADMRIGYSRVNNGYFNGKIDEVRLYNKPLSDQEVQDLYNSIGY